MTKPIPAPESGKLLRLAVPVIITYLGSMLMGLVDTLVVGQYSSKELAGVAEGSGIFWTVTMIGVGYLAAMDPIVAQAHGAKDPKTALRCLAVALQQCLVFSLVAIPIVLFISSHLAWTGATADVVSAAEPFLKVHALSLLPFVLFQALQRYWQGMEVALPFTLIVLLSNILNYILALAFVQGRWGFPAMGAEGVAWATLIVRVVGLLAAGMITASMWTKRPELRPAGIGLKNLVGRWDRLMQKQMLQLGFPASMHMSLEVCAFSLTTILIGRLGAQHLATHQIVLNIASFAFMFPLGLSAATATRVGYHIGRQDPHQAIHTSWLGIFLSMLIMSSSALVLFTFPEALLRIFTQDTEVIKLGVSIIFLCALFQIFDGIQVVSAGALRGLGDTKTALYANLVAHWCLGLPIGLTLCFVLHKGLWGLWVGLAFGLFFTAVFNTYAILRRRLA